MRNSFGDETLKNLYGNHMEGTEPFHYEDKYGSFQLDQVTEHDLMLWYFMIKPQYRGAGLSHLMIKRVLNLPQAQGKSIHLVAGPYTPEGEYPDNSTPYTNILRLFYEGHGFETIRYINDFGYYMINHNAD